MSTLEQLIRDAARRGELNYFSMIARGNVFEAVYGTAKHCINYHGRDVDPVKAAEAAFKSARKRVKEADDDDWLG